MSPGTRAGTRGTSTTIGFVSSSGSRRPIPACKPSCPIACSRCCDCDHLLPNPLPQFPLRFLVFRNLQRLCLVPPVLLPFIPGNEAPHAVQACLPKNDGHTNPVRRIHLFDGMVLGQAGVMKAAPTAIVSPPARI